MSWRTGLFSCLGALLGSGEDREDRCRLTGSGLLVRTMIPAAQEAEAGGFHIQGLSTFSALGYRVSSTTVRVTQRNPVSE